jgi:SAM-dependent methyltransferase
LLPINDKSKVPSNLDNNNYIKIRESVLTGVKNLADLVGKTDFAPLAGLEIAPQDHRVLQAFKSINCRIESLDINPNSNADFIADICEFNETIPDSSFDFIICTEVIEHVNNPHDAITELMRITKKSGLILFTSPFNFRIHGPLPDNWRISEWGWRTLLAKHEILSLEAVESSNRELFPIHYRIIVRKS